MAIDVTFEDLTEAIDAACIDGRVRSYSGRGMEGRECAAIVVDGIADLALFFVALPGVIDEDPAQNVAKRTRTDAMGHRMVAYWPGVTLGGEPSEEDDDD